MDLSKQYNNFAEDFSNNLDRDGANSNRQSREAFYSHIDFLKPGMKLLDLACGDGFDFVFYKKFGVDIYGLDASEELLKMAEKRMIAVELKSGLFEDIPFEDNFFDAVLSKYAIMTSANMEPVFKEIYRVLKPGGMMLYLVTHPFRQFFEKREDKPDYFEQKIVDSHILANTVTVQEPTHIMTEYLNNFLFKNFDVQSYDERWDPAAEFIDEIKYPGFFILKAKKR
jgi:ubiquinone/menaquinone biosynthesis C-methylase UbiE